MQQVTSSKFVGWWVAWVIRGFSLASSCRIFLGYFFPMDRSVFPLTFSLFGRASRRLSDERSSENPGNAEVLSGFSSERLQFGGRLRARFAPWQQTS